MDIAICYTIMSTENKQLLDAAAKRGVSLLRVPDSDAVLKITDNGHKSYDVVLQRSVSLSRGLCLAYYYERTGSAVINSYSATKICGDKMLCSLELSKAGVPTPRTRVAFSPEGAKAAAGEIGFPVVSKPLAGSWARMVHRLNDYDALEMELDSREEMGNPWQKIYYLQEHVNKPGRDIRAFVVGDAVVAAMYRHANESSGWTTNAGRGATCTPCAVTEELGELALAAAGTIGSGIYGVDMMETPTGLVVHEINATSEFKSCAATTGVDIAGAIIDYAVNVAKK